MTKQTRAIVVLPIGLAAMLTGGLGQKAGAEPWTRGYVVGTALGPRVR